MPAWTLGEIASAVTDALGKRTDIALSSVSFWANEAQRQVWDAVPHDAQERIAVTSVATDENKVTLPTDFQELLHLSTTTTTGRATSLRPINHWQTASYSSLSGSPLNYALYESWLELYPTPNSSVSLELRYRGQLTEMSALTSTPSVSSRYRYAVFLKTKQLVAQEVLRDADASASANMAYLSYMEQMPSDRALKMREARYATLSLPRRGRQP